MTVSGQPPLLPAALPAFVEHLATALVACRLHPPTHPAVVRPAEAAVDQLASIRQETGTEGIVLSAIDDCLAFQGRTPIPASLSTSRVVEALGRWQAGGLRTLPGVTAEEVATLLQLLVRAPSDAVQDLSALAKAAAQSGCRRIGLIAAAVAKRGAGTGARRVDVGRIRDALGDAFMGAAAGKALDLARIAQCANAILRAVDGSVRAGDEGLDLSRREGEDPLGIEHAIRVCALTMTTVRTMTAEAELVTRLGVAALLHDVGRMHLPLDLMQLDDTSADRDHERLVEHPVLGAEYLMAHEDIDPLCVAIAFGHHRMSGGGGQPWTCHEHRTSRLTQLVRTADLFEALTSRTRTRDAMTPIEAYRTLLAGDHGVDPGLVRRFVEANGVHPVGSLVRVGTGENVRVVRQTRTPDAPIVRVLTDGKSGAPKGALVDLSKAHGAVTRFVVPAAG